MKFRKTAGVLAAVLCLSLTAGCSEKNIENVNDQALEEVNAPASQQLLNAGEDIQLEDAAKENAAVSGQTEAVLQDNKETLAEGETDEALSGAEAQNNGELSGSDDSLFSALMAAEEGESEAGVADDEPSQNIGLKALAQVPNYVNVRSGPSTEDEVVGKIYNDCAADILDEVEGEDGNWYLMRSGNCEGYIKAEYFLVGEEAEAKREEVGVLMGTVTVEALRVRSEPDLDNPDNIFTLYPMGTEVFIDEMTEDGWAKITTDAASTGYVFGECMDIHKVFKTAITLEEEEAEIERKRQAEEAARIAEEEYLAALAQEEEAKAIAESQEAERIAAEESAAAEASIAQAEAEAQAAAAAAAAQAAAEAQAAAQAQAEAEARAAAEAAAAQAAAEAAAAQAAAEEAARQAAAAAAQATQAPQVAPVAVDSKAALRQAVCAFALQWVGYPYVHAGRTLEGGTDCSGFTRLVYAHFQEHIGYLLDYSPEYQQFQGTLVANAPVSESQLLPGDILFFPSSYKAVGHVAIYLGNNTLIHAANPTKGICLETFSTYRPPLFARRIIN